MAAWNSCDAPRCLLMSLDASLPLCPSPRYRYSALSAITGSTRAARLAGTQMATILTTASNSGMVINVSGSAYGQAFPELQTGPRISLKRADLR